MDEKDTILLDQILTRYRNRFINFAYSYIKDRAAAEDIYMDAVSKYWNKRENFTEDCNVYAYILSSIKNQSLNLLRHKLIEIRAHKNIADSSDREINFRINTLSACNPDELFSSDVEHIVKRTLEAMPTKSRTIFMMSRYENLSANEIAIKMELSTKSIEAHMTKVIKQLRIELKDYMPSIAFFI